MEVDMLTPQASALPSFLPDVPGRPRSLSSNSTYRSTSQERDYRSQQERKGKHPENHSQHAAPMPGSFPEDDAEPQPARENPQSRASSVTHTAHSPSPSLQDVSSLLSPFGYNDQDDHSSGSHGLGAGSKGKGKGKAVATFDGDMGLGDRFPPATEDEPDTDEDEAAMPVPRIVISEDHSQNENENDNGEGNRDRTDTDWDDTQSWTAYQPPPVLTEVLPDNLPEILAEVIHTSVENLQAQAARAVAAREARLEKEAAEKEAAREKAAQEKSKLEPWQTDKGIAWPQARESEESTPRPRPSLSIEPDTDLYLLSRMASDAGNPDPPSPTANIKQPKRSRRHLFAARLLRHVHMSSERGQSSVVGALSGARRSAEKFEGGKLWVQGQDGHWKPAPPTSGWTGPGSPEDSIATGLGVETGQHEPGMAPIPEQARRVMLQTMKGDSRKKKEPIAPLTIECISCFDDIPEGEAVKTVCHSYCLECFRQLITTALDNEAQFPPKCCLNEVPAKTVLRYVPRKLGQRYKAKAAEFEVPVDERLYCPTPDCGLFVPKKHISAAAHVGRCRNGHETCTICRQAAHGTGRDRQPCPEDRDQQMADDLAADAGWRRCIRCGVIIEHRAACQHMTCRCGAEFCFVCRAPWRTCQCDMDDLQRMKNAAAERRRVREAREAEEEAARARAAEEADRELEELREALRQVEEFEREETARLEEQRRQHRLRLEMLRRRRAAALRLEIEAKYAGYRQMLLADVMPLQRTAARQIRVDERIGRAERDAAALRALDDNQVADRAAAAEAAARRIQHAEQAWEQDYRARVRLEKQLEDAYRETLLDPRADLWAGRKDRAARVAAALTAYMRRNDERLDAYLRWRDRELETVRYLAEEEQCMALELLDRQRLRCVEEQQAEAAALRKRHAAERVWCRAVAAERLRLLAEREETEQGRGLEGSTAETDVELVMLMEMERAGDGLDGADMDYSLMLLASMGGVEAEDGDEGTGATETEAATCAGEVDGVSMDAFPARRRSSIGSISSIVTYISSRSSSSSSNQAGRSQVVRSMLNC